MSRHTCRSWGRWAWVACLSTLVLAVVERAYAVPALPALNARAGIVVDRVTGKVLWSDNADLALPPASTTKVMTAILALESGRLDDEIEVSRFAALQVPSKIRLFPGQSARLIDLVYAVMLNSANDAAVAIAEGVGGSVDEFADAMTRKARSIGATNSRFRNPHGLPDDEHVSSARDLATILRYALQTPGFRAIAATSAREIWVRGAGPRKIALRTHNRLLGNYFVPVVGKTGYTRAAGKCFVGAAEHDGRDVVVAVLGSSNLWPDVRRLLEFGLGVDEDEAERLQLASNDGGPVAEGDDDDEPVRGARRRAQRYPMQWRGAYADDGAELGQRSGRRSEITRLVCRGRKCVLHAPTRGRRLDSVARSKLARQRVAEVRRTPARVAAVAFRQRAVEAPSARRSVVREVPVPRSSARKEKAERTKVPAVASLGQNGAGKPAKAAAAKAKPGGGGASVASKSTASVKKSTAAKTRQRGQR